MDLRDLLAVSVEAAVLGGKEVKTLGGFSQLDEQMLSKDIELRVLIK